MTDLALIAGRGGLPAALVAALAERPYVCALDGFLPDGLTPNLVFRVERLVPLLDHLTERDIARVAFAGAVSRPRLDPQLFDPATAQLVPRLLAAMQGGDDSTLRAVVDLFEEGGFAVEGVDTLAPALLPGPGVLAGTLPAWAEDDAARAERIVAALGAVDVGQACVVAGGLCLGVEALPGTDALLAQLAALPDSMRPRRQGLLYKAAKPGQDRRVDLPTLGPDTLRHAAAAGLAGVVFQAGSVICLDQAVLKAEAEAQGLFLWAR